MKPVVFGLAGLGGYAGSICNMLLKQTMAAEPVIKLAAVCEPELEAHAETVEALRAQGITVVRDCADLLLQPIEAVWLPLPIPLHRPYTEQALLAGKAVMCEKPAAGCVQDVDAMIAARDHAGLPVAVGFQDIYKPSTMLLKNALLGGSIGKVRSATLTACWPRDSRYYARSSWAGRQKQNGAWVMDSPASNALAHFLNLALFLLGEADQSARLSHVEAELYRANPIENYDTCALRLTTHVGVSLIVCFTHACKDSRQPQLIVHGEDGKLIYDAWKDAVIETKQATETISLRNEPNEEMVERFARLVRGVPDQRAVATLEIARTHLVAVNGASEAAPVRHVSSSQIETLPAAEGAHQLAISGIEDLFEHCAEQQLLPHETGRASWTSSPCGLDLSDYNVFREPKISAV